MGYKVATERSITVNGRAFRKGEILPTMDIGTLQALEAQGLVVSTDDPPARPEKQDRRR